MVHLFNCFIYLYNFIIGTFSALLVTSLFLIIAKYKSKLYLPKGFSKKNFTTTNGRFSYIQPNRDRFMAKKVPQDLDVIVIGSGIGGLSCAAFLSRIGKRCLVLETTLYCWWVYSYIYRSWI